MCMRFGCNPQINFCHFFSVIFIRINLKLCRCFCQGLNISFRVTDQLLYLGTFYSAELTIPPHIKHTLILIIITNIMCITLKFYTDF